jgi:hypothetical protein
MTLRRSSRPGQRATLQAGAEPYEIMNEFSRKAGCTIPGRLAKKGIFDANFIRSAESLLVWGTGVTRLGADEIPG